MQSWIAVITAVAWPGVATYIVVALVVGIGSIGVPLPSETVVIAGVLLATRSGAPETPVGIWIAAVVGGVVGDNLAYLIGRRYGDRLMGWLNERWPRQFSIERIVYAKHLFQQHGEWAVVLGRFVALLRMLTGLLSGSLKLSYRRFVIADAAAVVVWAGIIVALTAWLGNAVRGVLSSLGWVLAPVALVVIIVAVRWVGRSFDKRAARYARRTQPA